MNDDEYRAVERAARALLADIEAEDAASERLITESIALLKIEIDKSRRKAVVH